MPAARAGDHRNRKRQWPLKLNRQGPAGRLWLVGWPWSPAWPSACSARGRRRATRWPDRRRDRPPAARCRLAGPGRGRRRRGLVVAQPPRSGDRAVWLWEAPATSRAGMPPRSGIDTPGASQPRRRLGDGHDRAALHPAVRGGRAGRDRRRLAGLARRPRTPRPNLHRCRHPRSRGLRVRGHLPARPHFGRILAAYGGVFVVGSLAWGMVVHGSDPTATTWWAPPCAWPEWP
jgi:hypothetical protein